MGSRYLVYALATAAIAAVAIAIRNLVRPTVTISPTGPDIYGDYGPNTPGTTTSGIKEAATALPNGGRIFIRGKATPYDVDFPTMALVTLTNILIEGESRESVTLRLTGTASPSLPNDFAFNFNGGGMENITVDGSALTIALSVNAQFGAIITVNGGKRPVLRRIAVNNFTCAAPGVTGLGVDLFDGPYAVVDDLEGTGNDVTLWVTQAYPFTVTDYDIHKVLDSVWVILTTGALSSVTLDGQTLYGGSYSVGQTFFVGASHSVIATDATLAATFEVLPI